MGTLPVIEHFDVVEDSRAGFFSGGKSLVMNEFILRLPKKLSCLARLHMQGSDLPQQLSIFDSVTALGPAQPVVKAAAGHAQGPAQPGYLELLAMPPNERVLHGSSRAKYA